MNPRIRHLCKHKGRSGQAAVSEFLGDVLNALDTLRRKVGGPTEGEGLPLSERLRSRALFAGTEDVAILKATTQFLQHHLVNWQGDTPGPIDPQRFLLYLDQTTCADVVHTDRLGAALATAEADPTAAKQLVARVIFSMAAVGQGPRKALVPIVDLPRLEPLGWTELFDVSLRPDFGSWIETLDGVELTFTGFRIN